MEKHPTRALLAVFRADNTQRRAALELYVCKRRIQCVQSTLQSKCCYPKPSSLGESEKAKHSQAHSISNSNSNSDEECEEGGRHRNLDVQLRSLRWGPKTNKRWPITSNTEVNQYVSERSSLGIDKKIRTELSGRCIIHSFLPFWRTQLCR